ncbi:MAG: MATE family efflux transporter [Clostridia bacterium]|nr:MATE family efflux transporter [Clostridia bacterium]
MLTAPLPKIITRMAFPTIVSFLITSIYSLADTYFVSSLGTNATAAVTVNGTLDQIIMMAGSMLAVGAASYISRLLGAKNEERANRVLSTAFFLALFFGLLVMVFGLLFMHPMVQLFGATDTCEQYSIEYATYVLLVAPFMATNFVMNHCLRAEGSAMRSLIGMGIGGVINCILDPFFILPIGLNLGVAGASIATAISKMISFVILLYPYLKKQAILHLKLINFRPDKDILYQILSIGSSSFFRSGLAVLAGILLNRIAGQISDSVLAGIGVSTRIMMFPFGIILGFGQGFQPVAGYSFGARHFDRVKQSYRFASAVAIIGGAVMGLILGIFAENVIALFAKTDEHMLNIATLCIRLQCVVLPVHAWVMVVNMLCGGTGYALFAFLLSISRQGICLLPILHLFARLWGETGVASVQAAADLLSLLLAVPIIIITLKRIDLAALQTDQS